MKGGEVGLPKYVHSDVAKSSVQYVCENLHRGLWRTHRLHSGH
jgi:hypothetical protein